MAGSGEVMTSQLVESVKPASEVTFEHLHHVQHQSVLEYLFNRLALQTSARIDQSMNTASKPI